MAVGISSPSGFSYAQAARGTTAPPSQTSSSQVTSGAATPAKSISLETSGGGNWADDVEDNEVPKVARPQAADSEEAKPALPKDSAIDRTKAEEKLLNGVSGVSSPETTGSSTASTATRDDSPSAPTGSSSDVTWDTKSQASEPAWIAERKERQNGSNGSEGTAKPERKSKKNASTQSEEPKAVVLQESLPPPVNPWQKRAEDAKAKVTAAPKPSPSVSSPAPLQKENQSPASNAQRNPPFTGSSQREPSRGGADAAQKGDPATTKQTSEVRISNRQNTKPAPREGRAESAAARSGTPQSRSLPNSTSALPSVKDEISWPTPEIAQDRERKESPEKESEEKRDDENTPASKRKKTEWKIVPVTPNVIWETPSMNESRERKPRTGGSERGGRGGARGRGSVRGGAAAATGDRGRTSPTSAAADAEQTPKDAANTGERGSAQSPPKQHASKPNERQTSLTETPASSSQLGDVKDASIQTSSVDATTDSHRARSPKKAVSTETADRDEIPTPAPIPRKTSSAVQVNDGAEKARSDPPVRMVATEGRKEPRNGDVFRDPNWTATSRGGRRGGRGRGGNGAPARDNPNTMPYNSNFPGDFGVPPTYGVPPSPSSLTRGNHHQFSSFPPPGSTRGGWSRGGPRSHSIPIESYYPRFASQQYGGAHGQMPNINTYMPGMSDFGPMPPMSALMPTPQEAQEHMLLMVTSQLEYYFGVENLIRDIFLRKHMDSQGFVFLDFIAGFNRLRNLTSDKDILRTACLNSELIEIRVGEDGKERLRKREGWQQFIRPMEERDPSAQTEGPQRLQRPEPPPLSMPNGLQHFQGPYSAGLPGMPQRMGHRSYDSGMMNGFAPQFVPNGDFHAPAYGGMVNGEEMRGGPAKSPIYENGVGPADRSFSSTEVESNGEADAFPDEQTNALGVVVKMSEQQPPYHTTASRTFSNGSIDSRSIAAELEKATDSETQRLPNGAPHTNGVDKMPSLTRHLSPNKPRSPEQGPPNVERQITWAKDVNVLPEGTTYEPYAELRMKALDQRHHAASGNCPYDLDVLYQFWCHFLCRNFNNKMYNEFRSCAFADASERQSLTGLQNLVKFYAHSLNSADSIRDRIAKDYVDLVKNEPASLEGAAFKQLRSAWRNGALNLKNRKKLSDIMDEPLKVALDKTES